MIKLWPARRISPAPPPDGAFALVVGLDPVIDPIEPTPAELVEINEALTKQLDEIVIERDELRAALDWQRPEPDAAVLGPLLHTAWFRPRTAGHWDHQARWAATAETAIEYVRGLWPLDPWTSTPQTVAGGSEEAVTPAAASSAGEPDAPGDNHAFRPDYALCAYCGAVASAPMSNRGWCRACEVAEFGAFVAKAPASLEEADPHRAVDDLAALTDAYIEDLARALCRHDIDTTGLRWDTAIPAWRDTYFNLAAAVVLAGWLPERIAHYPTGEPR